MRADRGVVVRMEQFQGRPAQQLVGGRGAEKAQGRLVDQHHLVRLVHQDRHRGVLDQGAVTALAFQSGLLGQPAVGHVLHRAGEDRTLHRVPPQLATPTEAADGAVGPDGAVLDVPRGGPLPVRPHRAPDQFAVVRMDQLEEGFEGRHGCVQWEPEKAEHLGRPGGLAVRQQAPAPDVRDALGLRQEMFLLPQGRCHPSLRSIEPGLSTAPQQAQPRAHGQHQDQAEGRNHLPASPQPSLEFGDVHAGDQIPRRVGNGAEHADHLLPPVIQTFDRSGLAQRGLDRQHLGLVQRDTPTQGGLPVEPEVTEEHHLVTFTPSQQGLGRAAGGRPQGQEGIKRTPGIDPQRDHPDRPLGVGPVVNWDHDGHMNLLVRFVSVEVANVDLARAQGLERHPTQVWRFPLGGRRDRQSDGSARAV